MRAYSQDLRQRILRVVDQGKPRAEIAKTFAVSQSTIKRYLKLRRETGDVKPKAIPGRPSKKGAALHAGLLAQLEALPDATLIEHCQFWQTTHGIQVSSATTSRAIHRLNWTRKKKTLRASEQNEADRAAWREQAKTLDASKLVFIDECGSNIALTSLYARSPFGERAYGAVPHNRRANITLLASLSLQGMGEALLLEDSADTTVFELYIEQILAPSLQAGQIVILDNLNTHTGEKVRQAIEAQGCQLLFLPSYSPDLSPIEEAFSKLKAFLRRVRARTPEESQEAIGQALLTITMQDAHGWFRHCGYRPVDMAG
ncbi:IS630 family transposase [Ktedonobacter robiniae]|uniref:IS630 family transposase n=1 Tax=Ktedonobacter robiniae TaxID=2778365 RepID=A0ABQ3UZV2_9CHLR|nr:IS630 family transposase [Ktedonobacter robiniae]GHO58192.1 IS630 family transposase [Ktedonobacter robiniae]